MHIIKLDATASSNGFLKKLWQDQKPEDETIVWALHQYGGRGQRGAQWHSEAGKNLTFSLLKYLNGLEVGQQFALNMLVSLAVHNALIELKIPDISVKWPNDILSGSHKICGILIENIVKASEIRSSVIGIGLNVNQENFGELKKAGSLKSITGRSFDLELLFSLVTEHLHNNLIDINTLNYADLKVRYEKELYRKGLPSAFMLPDGSKFTGIISGTTRTGQLIVETEQNKRVFNMKEISLLN